MNAIKLHVCVTLVQSSPGDVSLNTLHRLNAWESNKAYWLHSWHNNTSVPITHTCSLILIISVGRILTEFKLVMYILTLLELITHDHPLYIVELHLITNSIALAIQLVASYVHNRACSYECYDCYYYICRVEHCPGLKQGEYCSIYT